LKERGGTRQARGLGLIQECNITSLANSDGMLSLRGSDGISLVEDFLELLERAAHSLHTNEVPDNSLNDVPGNENEHKFILYVLQGDRRGIRVNEAELDDTKFQ
jgi:hypothetical protein